MPFDVSKPPFYTDDIQMSPLAASWIKDFLDDVIDKQKRQPHILEFGSGASTVWYSKTWPEAFITSIEGNKEWYDKVKPLLGNNVQYIFAEQDSNYRNPEVVDNPNYYLDSSGFGPHDLIINDGAMREKVGDFVLLHHEEYIRPGGLYLRHDYRKSIIGEWYGQHLGEPYWLVDKRVTLGYEDFCHRHRDYSLITVSGNGIWGYLAELGGVWRRP